MDWTRELLLVVVLYVQKYIQVFNNKKHLLNIIKVKYQTQYTVVDRYRTQ